MFFFSQETKENQIKSLKKDLLMERLNFFTGHYLEKQERKLLFEVIKSASDLRRLRNLTEEFAKQNVYLSETETAMINILEDAKELEKIIKEERDQSRAVVSSMGEGLLVIDVSYKIILLNKAAENTIGVSANELIGRDIRQIIEVFKGDKKLSDEEQPIKNVFGSGGIAAVKLEDDFYYRIIPSGKKFPVTFTSSPLKGNGITGAVIIFRDINLEKALNEARSNFISIASHQLRSPLTTVRWYTEMLQNGDLGSLNEDQKKFLSQIYDSVLKLSDTLNILLFLARIESKQVKIAPSKLNIFQFTEAVIGGFKLLTEGKKLDLTVETDVKNNDFNVFINQSFLDQVIVNLLSNAIRYTKEGGNIRIKIERLDKEIVYSIQDDGIGIPENQKNRIFEKFFRAENAKGKVVEGNGLGLVLVKNLVELWGGRIWFKSEENKGTTFYFTIPI